MKFKSMFSNKICNIYIITSILILIYFVFAITIASFSQWGLKDVLFLVLLLYIIPFSISNLLFIILLIDIFYKLVNRDHISFVCLLMAICIFVLVSYTHPFEDATNLQQTIHAYIKGR